MEKISWTVLVGNEEVFHRAVFLNLCETAARFIRRGPGRNRFASQHISKLFLRSYMQLT